jgi:hypothetical protein
LDKPFLSLSLSLIICIYPIVSSLDLLYNSHVDLFSLDRSNRTHAEFVYKNDSAIKVDKVVYYHCTPADDDSGAPAPRDGSRVFPLDTPGYAYFASADLERCKMGERLMINVLPAGGQPAAPGPGMPAPGPSTGGAGRSIAASSVRAVVLAVVAGLL